MGENPDVLIKDYLVDIDTPEDFENAEKIILNIKNSLEKITSNDFQPNS